MFRILFILLVLGSLSACVTPMRLGISEAEWQNYSPEQRQKIKNGYYEILQSHVRGNSEKVISDGSILHVKISGGRVSLPPFTQLASYTPVEFDISSGAHQKLDIKEQSGSRKVVLQAYYRNKT